MPDLALLIRCHDRNHLVCQDINNRVRLPQKTGLLYDKSWHWPPAYFKDGISCISFPELIIKEGNNAMKNKTLMSCTQSQSGSAWLVSRAIRSLGGADNSILSTLDFAEENNKFFVLGSLVLLAGFSAAYGMYLFLGSSLASYFALAGVGVTGLTNAMEQVLLSLSWGGAIMLIDRAIILSLRSKAQNTKATAFFWFRIVLSLFIAVIVSEPIKMKIYEQDISNQFKVNQLKGLKSTLQNHTQLQEMNAMLETCALVRPGVDVRKILAQLFAIEDCAKSAFEAESVGSLDEKKNGARLITCEASGETLPIRGQSCSYTPTCIDSNFYQIFSDDNRGEFVDKSTQWLACEQKQIAANNAYVKACASSFGYLKKWSISQKERMDYMISDEFNQYRQCSLRVARYQELQRDVDELNPKTFANKLALLTDVALNGFWNSLTFIGLTCLLWMLELGAVFAKFVLQTPLHDKLQYELGIAKSSVYSTITETIRQDSVLKGTKIGDLVNETILAQMTAIQLKESGLRLTAAKANVRGAILLPALKYLILIMLGYFLYQQRSSLPWKLVWMETLL